MTTVNVHEAKTHLSRLLEKVERGEEVIIARDGTPVARLVALPGRRVFGDLVGKMVIPEAFFEPLAEADLEPFGPPATDRRRRRKT
jgi:prevent-host-death family protein